MTTATEKKLLKKIKAYEGQTVGDFMYSDVAELIGIDIWEINGQGVKCGEDYDVNEFATISYIQVRNVMGYMIADITTEDA